MNDAVKACTKINRFKIFMSCELVESVADPCYDR